MKFYTKQLIKYCLCDDKYTMKDQMYAIENISFHLFFWFSRGPPSKKKIYVQAKIQSYNSNDKNRKSSTKLKEENK